MIATDVIQGDVRYRPHDHTYIHVPTNRPMDSVTKIINTIYATKSWDGVDPAVIENAARRGAAVDELLTQYVREGRLSFCAPMDVTERVVIAHRIYEEEFHGLQAEAQRIVYSVEDGIAGTADFFIDGHIIADLKATWTVEAAWILQLGAYSSYAPSPITRAGIIHVSPKSKKYKNGGQWLEFDVTECQRCWGKAVAWWHETKQLRKLLP